MFLTDSSAGAALAQCMFSCLALAKAQYPHGWGSTGLIELRVGLLCEVSSGVLWVLGCLS